MSESKKVVIVDAVPAYARGIASILQAHSYVTEEWIDLSLVERDNDTPMLLVVRTAEDWERLRACAGDDRRRCVVAVLLDPNTESYAQAFRCGARSVVEERAPVEEIVLVLEAAFENRTRLPADVAAALAKGHQRKVPEDIQLSTAHLHWIRALACGKTVTQLAVESCYSQREMYRSLRELYRQMGARNRTAAIVLATRWGIV